jgi:hypothetical protein
MAVNVDEMCHLAKSVMSCMLLSVCSQSSQAVEEGCVTGAVR